MSKFNLNKSKKIAVNINPNLYFLSRQVFKKDRYLKNILLSSGSFADLIECLLILYLNHPLETLKELNFDKYLYSYNGELQHPCVRLNPYVDKKLYLNYKNIEGALF